MGNSALKSGLIWSVMRLMSDPENQDREWQFYVRDMLEFGGKKVLAYTEGLDEATFATNSVIYDATLRNIQLIGEAATHIPVSVRESHADIPWRAIVGVRNRLAHSYLHISDSIIWSIVEDAIPESAAKDFATCWRPSVGG